MCLTLICLLQNHTEFSCCVIGDYYCVVYFVFFYSGVQICGCAGKTVLSPRKNCIKVALLSGIIPFPLAEFWPRGKPI